MLYRFLRHLFRHRHGWSYRLVHENDITSRPNSQRRTCIDCGREELRYWTLGHGWGRWEVQSPGRHDEERR